MADTGTGKWLPSYQGFPQAWGPHPRKRMLMTPLLVFLGGIFAFAVPTLVAAFFQLMFFNAPVSNNWAPLSASAIEGRKVFVANGCVYCHSGYTRPQDVRAGLLYLYPRISLPGDFVSNDSSPNLFGTARIGPDLSQDAGFHPDDWERAHFSDPRFVEPMSIMPSFAFFTDQQVEDLTTYLQVRAGKDGLLRYATELYAKKVQIIANGIEDPPIGFQGAKLTLNDVKDLAENGSNPPPGKIFGLEWPAPLNIFGVDRSYWLADNPLPVTKENLLRGRMVFQERCIGCHGDKGDAVSEAAKFLRPMPIDFTSADDAGGGDDTSAGMLYYRVLRGIQGTAMENFGTRLRVDDIWRVVLFLKTIPNGGLDPDKVPTTDMYIQWQPPDGLLELVKNMPIQKNVDFTEKSEPDDPFVLAARRFLAGFNNDDKFDLPGFGELSLAAARDGIKAIYNQLLDQGWNDYFTRGGSPSVPTSQRDILPAFRIDQR
ncbi:MAG: cbb3-type cytochrome c oxidase subunit II [Actinobacteria bacterium]|nr:cbb3-type cytochrome c oxidase subunit II [Actinomycetota bacterium]